MISALSWIPKGAAKPVPDRMELSKEELLALQQQEEAEAAAAAPGGESEGDAAEQAHPGADQGMGEEEGAEGAGDADLMAELNMDDYDDEEGGERMYGAGMRGEMYHENEGDPYISVPEQDVDRDSEEDEDFTLKETDALLLATKMEEDFSALEVHIFEEDTGNFYVHHDVSLPAFPLCVEWMNTRPNRATGSEGSVGNFAAVGTFKPGIEIWNLDVVDAVEPVGQLGGVMAQEVDRKKGRKRTRYVKGSHRGAVMGLSWNRKQRNVLASGSADETVKLWDLPSCKCVNTLNHHKGKVQGVEWHPTEAAVLATASFDKTARVMDARSPSKSASFALPSEAEDLVWNPHDASQLVISTDDGSVVCYDVRSADKALYSLKAHGEACSNVSFSPMIPGLMATASADGHVKIWDVLEGKPALVGSRDMAIGPVFSTRFYEHSPFVLASGGEGGVIAIWSIDENRGIERRFRSRVLPASVLEPVAVAAPAAEEEDDDDEEEEGGEGGAAAGAAGEEEEEDEESAAAVAAAQVPPGSVLGGLSEEKKKRKKRNKKNKKKGQAQAGAAAPVAEEEDE